MDHHEVWTADADKIIALFSAAVAEGAELSLQLGDGSTKTACALKLHPHDGGLYCIIRRPPDVPAPDLIQTIFFKISGSPSLNFSCRAINRSEKLLAFPLPPKLFFTQRREHPRFLTPQGSIASFQVSGKERASVCLLRDISMGGAKLHGSPAYEITLHDLIGPSIMTLTGYESLITREITLQKARVVRVRGNGKKELGIHFLLNNREKQQLSSHLNYLTRESPFPFQESPFVV